jgi:hypothetical protein
MHQICIAQTGAEIMKSQKIITAPTRNQAQDAIAAARELVPSRDSLYLNGHSEIWIKYARRQTLIKVSYFIDGYMAGQTSIEQRRRS